MEDYNTCFSYLKKAGLWEKRNDESLLLDEQNFIIFCYYACGLIFSDIDITWDQCKNNNKLLILMEIIMENSKKCTYTINNKAKFETALIHIQNLHIKCSNKEYNKFDLNELLQQNDTDKKITSFKNTKNINEEKANDAIKQFMDTCDLIKKGTIVKKGETKEEYINRMENSIDIILTAFNNIFLSLDKLICSSIKDDIYLYIDSGLSGKNDKKDLFKMAERCNKYIEDEIEFIIELEKDLGENFTENTIEIVTLKAINGNGKKYSKSIFDVFADACALIGKKLAQKFYQWFKTDKEDAIFSAIYKKLSDTANTLHKHIDFSSNAVQSSLNHVLDGITSGVIKTIETIKPNTITAIFIKQKQYKIICNNCFDKIDVFADEVEYEYISKELNKNF